MSLSAVLLLAVTLAAAAADPSGEWSRFRGPNGSGVAETSGLPVEFGPTRNLIWKTDLPQGYSSPIVHGNPIFLTGVRDGKLVSFAVDRTTGKVLWSEKRRGPGARSSISGIIQLRRRRQPMVNASSSSSPTTVSSPTT